jgi:hypothetical protein
VAAKGLQTASDLGGCAGEEEEEVVVVVVVGGRGGGEVSTQR